MSKSIDMALIKSIHVLFQQQDEQEEGTTVSHRSL